MYFWLKEIGIDGIPRIGEHKGDQRARLCLSYTAGTTALSALSTSTAPDPTQRHMPAVLA